MNIDISKYKLVKPDKIEKKNGVWSFKNKVEGFDISSRYFEFSSDTTILVSHEYKGVYTLALDLGYTNVSNVKKHTSVTKGSNSSIAKFYDRLLYANEEGVYFLDTKTDTFLKEETLSTIFSKESYVSGKLETNVSEMLWFFTKDGITYITKEPFTDSYIIKTMQIPISLRKQKKGFENISRINSQQFLSGTSNGYFLINTK